MASFAWMRLAARAFTRVFAAGYVFSMSAVSMTLLFSQGNSPASRIANEPPRSGGSSLICSQHSIKGPATTPVSPQPYGGSVNEAPHLRGNSFSPCRNLKGSERPLSHKRAQNSLRCSTTARTEELLVSLPRGAQINRHNAILAKLMDIMGRDSAGTFALAYLLKNKLVIMLFERKIETHPPSRVQVLRRARR